MAVADKSSTIADDVGDGGDVGDGDDVGDGGDVGDFCLVWLDMCVCRGTMAAPPLQSSLVPHLNSKMICSWFMLPLVLFGCFVYLFCFSVLFICFIYLFCLSVFFGCYDQLVVAPVSSNVGLWQFKAA